MTDEIPVNGARLVAGYDGDYAVTADGEVWSKKRGQWFRKSQWYEHDHLTVELWRYGLVTRRRVSVLVRETFGRTDAVDAREDQELRWYLEQQYGMTQGELADLFAGQ